MRELKLPRSQLLPGVVSAAMLAALAVAALNYALLTALWLALF